MTIKNVKQVEKLISKMDLSNIRRPSKELFNEILTSGRSRILKTAPSEGLCPLSVEFFSFCWISVSRFGAHSYNAVEIGALCNIQPIYIACAIQEHGMDWGYRFFKLKRIDGMDRGEFSVSSSQYWTWSVYEVKRRVASYISMNNADPEIAPTYTRLRYILRTGTPSEAIDAIRSLDVRIASLICHKNYPLFNDSRKQAEPKSVKKPNAMTINARRIHSMAVTAVPKDPAAPSGPARRIKGTTHSFKLPN